MRIFKILLLGIFVCTALGLRGQDFEWAYQIAGNGNERGESIEVAISGHVYIAGFFQDTLDADPGMNTYNLIDNGINTGFIIKLDTLGNLIWAKAIGGNDDTRIFDLAVDSKGSVYLTGRFSQTADFNPGLDTLNITANGLVDGFLLKLDDQGDFSWVNHFGSTGYQFGQDVSVDEFDNIYTCGNFMGIVDFDPSSSVFNLTGSGDFDGFIFKSDSIGSLLWAYGFGASEFDQFRDMDLRNGKVAITGSFRGSVDFDPGPASEIRTSTFSGFPIPTAKTNPFLLNLNYDGSFNWVYTQPSSTSKNGLVCQIDNSNNVYFFSDWNGINKISQNGSSVFNLAESSLAISVRSLSIDSDNNLFSSGNFTGTVDLDPNSSVYNATSGIGASTFIRKFNSVGQTKFVSTFGGPISTSVFSTKIFNNSLYLTGMYVGNSDFDPSTSQYILNAISGEDGYISRIKLPPLPIYIHFDSTSKISGQVGEILTLFGQNFDQGSAPSVRLGAVKTNVISYNDSVITAAVPIGATFDPISVETDSGIAYSNEKFSTTFSGAEGINQNSYDLPQVLSTGIDPHYLTTLDVDGDGKVDLITPNQGDNNISVFRNIGSPGNTSFAARVNFTTGTQPREVAYGDLDLDGKPDLVVANLGGNTISVFKNSSTSGNISFASKVDFPVGTNPAYVQIRDFDGDGKPDVAVSNFNSNSITLFQNVSSQGIIDASSLVNGGILATAANPHRLQAEDMDRDGKIDLIATNLNAGNAQIFRNISTPGVFNSGSFASPASISLGTSPNGLSIGDLNGDGYPEIVAYATVVEQIVIRENQSSPGNLAFANSLNIQVGGSDTEVEISDLDGDGHLDIAVAHLRDQKVELIRNKGLGGTIVFSSFDPAVDIPSLGSVDVEFADLDGDSLPDMIVPQVTNDNIYIYRRLLNPPPPPKIDSLSPQSGPIASVVKVHGEHFNDTAANNTVWFGSTEGTVLNATETELDVEVPLGARFLPLTVTTSSGTGYSNKPFVTTYDRALGINSSSFEPRIDVPTGATTVYNAVGDLDGDGRNDVVQANFNVGNFLSVFRNTTTGSSPTFATKFDLSSNGIPADVDLVDIDLDGKLDIVTINQNTAILSVYRNVYSGGTMNASSFASRVDIAVGSNPNYVEIQDMDADGKPDYVFANPSTGDIKFLKNTSVPGSITFGTSFNLSTSGVFCLGLEIGDLNGDGKPEIIVGNNGSSFMSVFENRTTYNNPRASSFVRVNYPIGIPASHGVAMGDLDGDGDNEIGVVVFNSVRVFKNNSIPGQPLNGSSLGTFIELPLNANSTRLEFTDMDGDGKLDIVAANHVGGNSVSVIKNNSTPSSMTPGDFETPVILSTGPSSGPHFMSVADINNDSLPDIITSNNSNNFMSIFLRKLNPCQDPTLPVFSTSSDSICASDSTWIKVDGGSLNDATAWHWYTGSCGGTLIGVGDSIKVSATSNFIVRVRGEGGCVTPGPCYAQNVVVGNTGGGISASVNDTLVCLGDPLTFTASGGTNYQWSGGITNGQTFTTTSPGILLSYVTGEDAFGCTSEDSVYSFVSESYSLADKGKFIGSGFESYIPLYFYCDAAETDSSLYNFNSHWISFTDIFSFIFAPFGSGCPSTTSINQSSDSYEGLNALRMDADTNGFAEASISGILAGRPNKLQGYFKTNAGPNDTIAVLVGAVETGLPASSQDSANYIGYGEFVSTGSTGTYTQFEVPINYSGSAPTDSFEISLVFVNSATSGGVKSLWFDAFNLVYDTTVLSICSGDSTFLGGAWQTTAGLYTDNLLTEFGCDSVVLTELELLPAAIVNAGTDQSFCADVSNISLNGSFSNATSALWSGGAGVFTPNANDPNAVYTPTAAEKSSGSVNLVLTTAGTGSCSLRSDTVSFTFDAVPVVQAGPNQNLCADITSLNLAGSVTNASGGIWSNGSGTFSPSNTALNATYTPTVAEKNNGLITLVLTSTGNGACASSFDTVLISFDAVPTANAGTNQTFCEDVGPITLNGSFANASGISWTGGNGTFSPNAQTENATYTPSATELTSGSVTLTLTTTGNGACNSASDAVTITFDPLPTVNAGSDFSACANETSISLSGIVNGATGGIWSSSGFGIFSPSSTDLNASYAPTISDRLNGFIDIVLSSTGNGNCNAITDTVRITLDPVPIADAGLDLSRCANLDTATLDGSLVNATGGFWSGAGTFAPNNTSLNPLYTPTTAEVNSGSALITFESTGNGACPAAQDTVIINYTPAPTAIAGPDQTVCENVGSVQLAGSSTNSDGVNWTSSGSGTFSPNSGIVNPTYSPSASDLSAGSVNLILRANAVGCDFEFDTMTINFDPLPVVNAGSDLSICDNNVNITLSGSVTNATGGTWTGAGGTFTPSNTDLNAGYTPSASELSAGSSTLILSSTGNGNCSAQSDTVLITYTTSPTVNAGADQTICANANITLNGSVTVSTGGTWSGGTGTFTPSANDLNANYSPSASEISNGLVQLILTSTGNGNCSPVSDTVILTLSPAPIVDAGADQSFCADTTSFGLNGSVTNATGGTWTGGTGNFTPSANDLNATYTPSSGDIAAGSVSLILTSTGNGNCNAESDTVTFTFDPLPLVDAGPDQSICDNIGTVQLNGSVTNATGGVWNTVGTGTFSPNATTLNASYIPSIQDLANGVVNITLTTLGTGQCASVFDQVNITFNAAPLVDLGQDSILCSNFNQSITLDAGSGFAAYLWSDGSTNQTLLVDEAFNTSNGDIVSVEVTDNNTCRNSDTVSIGFSICGALTGTGTELINTIYPNPTSDRLIIELSKSEKVRLSIYDTKGVLMLEKLADAKEIQLYLRDLPAAKYILKIQGDDIDVQTGIIKN